MSAQRSIVIGGGAFAGLGLALGLRQGLGTDIPSSSPIRRWGSGRAANPRATAIVAACRRLFETIGVVGSGRRRGAADSRYGCDRFQAGGRDPSGVS